MNRCLYVMQLATLPLLSPVTLHVTLAMLCHAVTSKHCATMMARMLHMQALHQAPRQGCGGAFLFCIHHMKLSAHISMQLYVHVHSHPRLCAAICYPWRGHIDITHIASHPIGYCCIERRIKIIEIYFQFSGTFLVLCCLSKGKG